MKKRSTLQWIVDIIGLVLLAVAVLTIYKQSTTPSVSATPTNPIPPTATRLFEHFPTQPPVSTSPTTIPLRATYTSIIGETPNLLATQTLLPIDTPTLFPSDTPSDDFPTATLISFPTAAPTALRGTATPFVTVAYSVDGKPKPCYKGPSLSYIEMDTFKVSRIAGKDSTGEWWYLLVFKGQGVYVSCWVARDLVTTGGNLDNLSVVEPDLSDITQVKISVPGQPVTDNQYIATIPCDDGVTKTTLRFVGQVFANGPLNNIGYRWDTDAALKFKAAHGIIKSWDVPAETTLELPIPSTAASYSLNLRTTFPVEVVSEIQVIIKCE